MENTTNLNSVYSTPFQGSTIPKFSWYDYVFVTLMMGISLGLGIFFGCCGNKQSTANMYLLGGKQMRVIPVTLSLIASHTSGITLLGVPADVYAFGANYFLASVSLLIVATMTVLAFIPVFYDLQITSTYEYLGRRFDERARKCSSFLYVLSTFMYIPIVVYMSALTFSAAIEIDVYIITPIVCGICIFYTSIGGLKALVWIDSIQFVVNFGIILILLGLSVNSNGGIATFLRLPSVQERLDFWDLSPSLTKRDTVLGMLIGFTTHLVAETTVNQSYVQKFLAVSTLNKSKCAIMLYGVGMATVKAICVIWGLVLSAAYANCDPSATNKIERTDQLLPHYLLEIKKDIPGLSGLFTGGILTASLSMLSGSFNSLSGAIYEDLLKKPLLTMGIKNEGLILQIFVVIIGVIGFLLVYIVENMGGLLSLAIGLGSVAQGPLLGMFLLGLFFPTANAKGSFFGAMTSIVVMAIVITGNNYYKMTKQLNYPHKTISVDGCNFFVNSTVATKFINETVGTRGDDIFPLFRISFYWCTLFGSLVCVITGLIISYFTEPNEPPIPKKFLSPLIYPLLSKYRDGIKTDYEGVGDASIPLTLPELRG